MASFQVIITIFVIVNVLAISFSQEVDTLVEVTSLVNPITVGGLMAIQCRLWNMQERYIVNIFRVFNGRIEKITEGKSYLDSSLSNRVFLASRVFSDRTHVYVLTLVGITHDDQGEYGCRAEHVSVEGTNTIATDRVRIDLYSFPNKIYPVCESEPVQPITLYARDRLLLTCSSERSSPRVDLNWSSTHQNIRIVSRNTSNDATTSSQVILIADISYHGAIFTCHLSSRGFPNRQRTCHIGPIIIHNMESVADNVDITQSLIPKTGRDHVVKKNTQDATGCSSQCSPEDEEIVLYLTISTIGASILCILFLTTTIIFCFKYHSISTDAIEVRRTVPGNDGSDPVYVSLQRRQEYDRNSICSTYMTVEDPNNPGSKVLMPKEVFDEFYRTLTIKRV